MTTVFYTNIQGLKFVYHTDDKPEVIEGTFLKFRDKKLGVLLLPASRCEVKMDGD